MAEEQACLDLADLILETAQKVDRIAQTSLAPGALHTQSINQSIYICCLRTFQGSQKAMIGELTYTKHQNVQGV